MNDSTKDKSLINRAVNWLFGSPEPAVTEESAQGSGSTAPPKIDVFGRYTQPSSSGSMLAEETRYMENQRREIEQAGHRQIAYVNVKEHADNEPQLGQEAELQNGILQNPWLDNQRFDGVDPDVNPEPPLNSEARREFDNQRREQEMEKQLRLGNMPKFSSAPRPEGPQ